MLAAIIQKKQVAKLIIEYGINANEIDRAVYVIRL